MDPVTSELTKSGGIFHSLRRGLETKRAEEETGKTYEAVITVSSSRLEKERLVGIKLDLHVLDHFDHSVHRK